MTATLMVMMTVMMMLLLLLHDDGGGDDDGGDDEGDAGADDYENHDCEDDGDDMLMMMMTTLLLLIMMTVRMSIVTMSRVMMTLLLRMTDFYDRDQIRIGTRSNASRCCSPFKHQSYSRRSSVITRFRGHPWTPSGTASCNPRCAGLG